MQAEGAAPTRVACVHLLQSPALLTISPLLRCLLAIRRFFRVQYTKTCSMKYIAYLCWYLWCALPCYVVPLKHRRELLLSIIVEVFVFYRARGANASRGQGTFKIDPSVGCLLPLLLNASNAAERFLCWNDHFYLDEVFPPPWHVFFLPWHVVTDYPPPLPLLLKLFMHVFLFCCCCPFVLSGLRVPAGIAPLLPYLAALPTHFVRPHKSHHRPLAWLYGARPGEAII